MSLVFVFAIPKQSLAYTSNSVCRNIYNIESSLQKEQSKIRSEVNIIRIQRSEDLKNEWQNRNSAFAEKRNNSDEIYKRVIASIKAKTETASEISAVENFEKEILNALFDSREKVDVVWQEYEDSILLSLSNQDSVSEKYFQDIQKEGNTKIGKISSLCKTKSSSEIKTQMRDIKQIETRGLARSAFIRISKLEINQSAGLRDEKLKEIQEELVSKIKDLYNSLPETLKK